MLILQLLKSESTIPERLKGENDDIRWFSIAIIEPIYRVWFPLLQLLSALLHSRRKKRSQQQGMRWNHTHGMSSFAWSVINLNDPFIVLLYMLEFNRESIWIREKKIHLRSLLPDLSTFARLCTQAGPVELRKALC